MDKDINQLHTSLAVISEKLDGVNEHLRVLNGKAVTNMKDIDELKISEASIISSFRSAKWVAGIASVLVLGILSVASGLAVYAYQGDRTQDNKEREIVATEVKRVAGVAETAKEDLALYQKDLLVRLEALIPAEKLKALKQKEEDDNRPAVSEAELDPSIPTISGVNKNGSPKNK